MKWLENQFLEEPDPTHNLPPFHVSVMHTARQAGKVLATFGMTLQVSAETFAKNMQMIGIELNKLQDRPPQEGIKTRHDRQQRYRENPPHWQAQAYAYDKRGRKRY